MTKDCLFAEPIYISKDDVLTDQTARDILRHNELWETICKKKKPVVD